MDLRTGSSFWSRMASSSPSYPALRRNVHCDVAIVGGGLSGAFIAHSLSQAGLDVVLVEKRAIGNGSTSASTALVLYEIDTPLFQLIRMRGEDTAMRCYRCCLQTIKTLEKLVAGWRNNCGFRRRPSLYLASRKKDVGNLKKEFQARSRAGFHVRYLTTDNIENRFSFTASGAILSVDAAEINPLQLTYELVRAAQKKRARVFASTKVIRTTEHQHSVRVRTSNGQEIIARWVINACGFETKSPIIRQIVKLKSTYALVTEPIRPFPRWYNRSLIWETARPYFYLRSTSDNRIMIGGADEDFYDPKTRDQLLPFKTRLLQNKLKKLFPDIPITPAFCWTGTFGETKDGLPYIGAVRPDSRILYALCYGANGTNFAILAADILRDLILNQPNANTDLFSFER